MPETSDGGPGTGEAQNETRATIAGETAISFTAISQRVFLF
jgi:hypothetical protein